MNQSFPDSKEASDLVPKQISGVSKTSSKCTAPLGSNFDPYAVLFDLDGAIRDIGPYKTFIEITRSTLDHTRISECSIEAGKGPANEREIPEPNVTFSLCRGSWSSPALRVYTADDMVNELVKARLECWRCCLQPNPLRLAKN
ncbi:hypothetical protein HanHA300_Chr07g0256211 [Helianthus annuus]|nr:hypothetical protein HanHA300_Chr07g0256211 [Helianthus annuus]KAJ0564317.1 hypothetical protein HanHA89_Chr07g0272951 [Helianthus annuus]KAJ0729650.1 hypothetical protein HanLR1_Chr07g0255301 [Helianthus annuus]KAJ0732389.1 hypothetical protein HanOQP8_Chr07g0262641 [Helianthus annuus]